VEDHTREPDGQLVSLVVNAETLAHVAEIDGVVSLRRALSGIETSDEAWKTAGLITRTMAEQRLGEPEAADAAGVGLSVPVAAALLTFYLYRWAEGGVDATTRLTAIVDPSQLLPAGQERNLLHWIWSCAWALASFSASLEDVDGDPVRELEDEAATAAESFRRLARVLRAAGATDVSLACALSAVNLALRSDEAADSVDLALDVAALSDDPAVSLRLKARQADVLARRCAREAELAVPAFDAAESVLRHAGDVPEVRDEILPLLADGINAAPVLAGIRPLFQAASRSAAADSPIEKALRLLASARWTVAWEEVGELAEFISQLAIHLENARRELEPRPDAQAAETRWATWAFEYPPFQRAVPHGASLQRETGLQEVFLTVAHETIHVLSMGSALGRAVVALRLALLEIEFRLWTFMGPADPEGFRSAGVAPLVDGEITALAQAEQALEISRKLQILQDVWGPWLEGVAMFGELAATSPDDPWASLVTQVLANLMEEETVLETAERRGMRPSEVIADRQAHADQIYEAAGRHQAESRLRELLADYPTKYLAGYFTVRSVVSRWRRTYGSGLSAQMAFRVLLHLTRFGTAETVPDLALSPDAFRERALAGLRDWVDQLGSVTRNDLDHFRQPPEGFEVPLQWRGGRLAAAPAAGADLYRATLEDLTSSRDRALLTLTEPLADLDRVSDAGDETRELLEAAAQALSLQRFSLTDPDADPGLIERMLGRTAVMPIGRVRSPFWLVQPSSWLVVLLRTTDPPQGEPLHQLVASQLSDQEAAELEREMQVRRDSRMTVARVADIADPQVSPEFRGAGINYLVFAYGDWVHVEPRGVAFGSTSAIPETLVTQARERIQPDAILDFESDLTSEGRAGAQRTRQWLENVDRWTAEGQEYEAGRWAAHVQKLADEVLDRTSHLENELASTGLLSMMVGEAKAPVLVERGLEVLRPMDARWIGEVARVFAASSRGPVTSSFLDDHAVEVNECLGPVFIRDAQGWDVRPIGEEA
jgi:hypothetical protein